MEKIMTAVDLHVAGESPYLHEMKANLAGTPTIFTGYLQGDDLVSAYNACSLFVFPSSTDTIGNVVLEAQACGLPVVVTDSGGPQENVLGGVTGVIVPARDPGLLKTTPEVLLSDPAQMEKMGKAARRYMEERSFQLACNETWSMHQDETAAIEPFAEAV